MIGNPRPEDWVKRSLADNSTTRSTPPPKIHWLVWFGVGLGICLLLFLLRRKEISVIIVNGKHSMTAGFVSEKPSAKADATRTNEFGAKSKSPLKWTE